MSIFESIVFLAFLFFFRIPLSLNILYLPVVIFLFFIIALGISMALAALNVYYRDIQYIWAVVLQIGFFATPVIYPLSVFPLYLQKILSYNPIAQVIFLARDITLYSKEPNPASFVFVIFIAMIILGIGYVIFMRLEKRFAEEL
jgi:lipopolysaccharide transport system permease protein